MMPGLEMMACPEMAVSMDVMQHVINVESSRNPYAIGVVGGALVRQPKQLDEALATVRMLEEKGYNFSVGLAQVNRYNLVKYGLDSYEKAFQQCPNLQAASRILAECYGRSGKDWGKSFSCYYSGNFTTGFRHGYVQKVFASIARQRGSMVAANGALPIDVVSRAERRVVDVEHHPQFSRQPQDLVGARVQAMQAEAPAHTSAVTPVDPARAYEVYPSTGAMLRRDAVRAADATLSGALMGAVERATPQPVPAAASPLQQNNAGPVVVRPWSERNAPLAAASQDLPAESAPVQNVPAGDAAFVF
jgi:type IV secretion system protein VirB1